MPIRALTRSKQASPFERPTKASRGPKNGGADFELPSAAAPQVPMSARQRAKAAAERLNEVISRSKEQRAEKKSARAEDKHLQSKLDADYERLINKGVLSSKKYATLPSVPLPVPDIDALAEASTKKAPSNPPAAKRASRAAFGLEGLKVDAEAEAALQSVLASMPSTAADGTPSTKKGRTAPKTVTVTAGVAEADGLRVKKVGGFVLTSFSRDTNGGAQGKGGGATPTPASDATAAQGGLEVKMRPAAARAANTYYSIMSDIVVGDRHERGTHKATLPILEEAKRTAAAAAAAEESSWREQLAARADAAAAVADHLGASTVVGSTTTAPAGSAGGVTEKVLAAMSAAGGGATGSASDAATAAAKRAKAVAAARAVAVLEEELRGGGVAADDVGVGDADADGVVVGRGRYPFRSSAAAQDAVAFPTRTAMEGPTKSLFGGGVAVGDTDASAAKGKALKKEGRAKGGDDDVGVDGMAGKDATRFAEVSGGSVSRSARVRGASLQSGDGGVGEVTPSVPSKRSRSASAEKGRQSSTEKGRVGSAEKTRGVSAEKEGSKRAAQQVVSSKGAAKGRGTAEVDNDALAFPTHDADDAEAVVKASNVKKSKAREAKGEAVSVSVDVGVKQRSHGGPEVEGVGLAAPAKVGAVDALKWERWSEKDARVRLSAAIGELVEVHESALRQLLDEVKGGAGAGAFFLQGTPRGYGWGCGVSGGVTGGAVQPKDLWQTARVEVAAATLSKALSTVAKSVISSRSEDASHAESQRRDAKAIPRDIAVEVLAALQQLRKMSEPLGQKVWSLAVQRMMGGGGGGEESGALEEAEGESGSEADVDAEASEGSESEDEDDGDDEEDEEDEEEEDSDDDGPVKRPRGGVTAEAEGEESEEEGGVGSVPLPAVLRTVLRAYKLPSVTTAAHLASPPGGTISSALDFYTPTMAAVVGAIVSVSPTEALRHRLLSPAVGTLYAALDECVSAASPPGATLAAAATMAAICNARHVMSPDVIAGAAMARIRATATAADFSAAATEEAEVDGSAHGARKAKGQGKGAKGTAGRGASKSPLLIQLEAAGGLGSVVFSDKDLDAVGACEKGSAASRFAVLSASRCARATSIALAAGVAPLEAVVSADTLVVSHLRAVAPHAGALGVLACGLRARVAELRPLGVTAKAAIRLCEAARRERLSNAGVDGDAGDDGEDADELLEAAVEVLKVVIEEELGGEDSDEEQQRQQAAEMVWKNPRSRAAAIASAAHSLCAFSDALVRVAKIPRAVRFQVVRPLPLPLYDPMLPSVTADRAAVVSAARLTRGSEFVEKLPPAVLRAAKAVSHNEDADWVRSVEKKAALADARSRRRVAKAQRRAKIREVRGEAKDAHASVAAKEAVVASVKDARNKQVGGWLQESQAVWKREQRNKTRFRAAQQAVSEARRKHSAVASLSHAGQSALAPIPFAQQGDSVGGRGTGKRQAARMERKTEGAARQASASARAIARKYGS